MMTGDTGLKVKSTPWGPSQHGHRIAEGIELHSTASHGGVWLSAERNAQVPDYMRCADGWYEEDCDWCIPALWFSNEWYAWAERQGRNPMGGVGELLNAVLTFKNWHPDAYERFTGTTLRLGDSYLKDNPLPLRRA